MNRVKLFFLFDGVIIAAGVLFLFWTLSRRGQSQFRDDLWEERKAAEKSGRLAEFEAKVDQKILLEHRLDPKDKVEPASKAGTQPPFRVPNFRGKPHDILGIPEGAPADTVNAAFKFWIKRYHPDRVAHLGGGYVEQARRRAEQLNSARQTLLSRRKS